ncbi:MAG: cytochrome b5-like heme/steroid binding domain-containing protein [Minisyncoccia bacterium]|jgi:cytochrome b involved in lipid metabolism
MSHKILIGIAIVAAAVLCFAWLSVNHTATLPTETSTGTPEFSVSSTTAQTTLPTSSSSTPATSFTLAEIAAHNNASSCWSAINGKVYDLTSWINQHPGGPGHILSICGIDGSAAFNAQHSGQARPASELANFYIGTLAQ